MIVEVVVLCDHQGPGSEEAYLPEDSSLRTLWPKRVPLGGSQKPELLSRALFTDNAVVEHRPLYMGVCVGVCVCGRGCGVCDRDAPFPEK